MVNRILPRPWFPDLFRSCPACGRFFALRQVSQRKDEIAVVVVTFRCKRCGKEVSAAVTRPPHCV